MIVDPRRVARLYYELVDRGDISGLVGLFAPDAVYNRPGYPSLQGRSEIEDFYRNSRVIESGRHSLDKVLAEGLSVATEGKFSGRLKDGSLVTARFADFFTLDIDGRFTRRDTYFFSPLV